MKPIEVIESGSRPKPNVLPALFSQIRTNGTNRAGYQHDSMVPISTHGTRYFRSTFRLSYYKQMYCEQLR